MIFAPALANKFVELDPETGAVKEWKSPFYTGKEDLSPYGPNSGVGAFIREWDNPDHYTFISTPERAIYRMDFDTNTAEKVDFQVNKADLIAHEPGFTTNSQWLQYSCMESCFNSLDMLLEDRLIGKPFSKAAQLKAFSQVNAAVDGDCGQKVYEFMKNRTVNK